MDGHEISEVHDRMTTLVMLANKIESSVGAENVAGNIGRLRATNDEEVNR